MRKTENTYLISMSIQWGFLWWTLVWCWHKSCCRDIQERGRYDLNHAQWSRKTQKEECCSWHRESLAWWHYSLRNILLFQWWVPPPTRYSCCRVKKKSVNDVYLAPLILACTSSLFIYLSVEQQKRLILSAMSHWENNTCIRFRPKNSTDQYSIYIMSGPVHA